MYQLVIQFRGDGMPTLEALIHLEDQFLDTLGETADVDGHDIGDGEANIFVMTADPDAALARVLPILKAERSFPKVRAAYRHIEGETYTVLWPADFYGKFTVQ